MPPAVLIVGQLPDPHIQAVVVELHSLGASVAGFNRLADEGSALNFELSSNARRGWLSLDGRRWELSGFHAVWWRVKPYTVAEQLGQAPALPEAFAIREWRSVLESLPAYTPQAGWINPRPGELAARHKPVQLAAACQAGFTIPPTLITNDAEQAIRFLETSRSEAAADFRSPGAEFIYKPLTWYAEPPISCCSLPW